MEVFQIRKINNVFYYTTGDVAALCGRSLQTINLWDKYSQSLEKEGKPRLIPKALKINNIKLYTKQQVAQIRKFAGSISYGTMADFNRKRLNKKERM